METLRLKRGDDLVLDCAVEGDLTGWSVRSQVRFPNGRLLAECAVSPLLYDAGEDVTRYALAVGHAATAEWTPGTAWMDIEYTDLSGIVQSTETVSVAVVADVSR